MLRGWGHWGLELMPIHDSFAVEFLAEGVQLCGAFVRQDAQLLDDRTFVRELCLCALE